jgi:glycosyltransferase involved in cell wall biosynthesis
VAEASALAVAVVTPWFGAELTGGAERTAWQLAVGLAERGHRVDVFTTSSLSFDSEWGVNARPAGTSRERGVTIRRFPVDERDAERFARATAILLGRPPAYYRDHRALREPEVADDFVRCGITSKAAIAALRADVDAFDAVIVLPYPYGLGLAAIDAVGSRAILVPCLHDEPYAYLPAVERAVRAAGLLAFNTDGERRLADRLYGPAIALRSVVVGQWVEAEPELRAVDRIGAFRPAEHRYVLYLGRRDESKNVDLLAESFAAFRRRERISTLELVLVGNGRRSFADRGHGISDLGHVDEAQKAALLAHALAVVQPSVNESFSRAVMEGWRAGKPALVNARCAATAETVREAAGGWMASTKAEWSAAFGALDQLPEAERVAAGTRGRAYVEEETAREKILDRYEAAIRAVRARSPRTRFDVSPAPALLRWLGADGRQTILFAGPLDAAAGAEELLAGFAHLLSFGIDARLVLLGAFEPAVADGFYDAVGKARLSERILVVEPQRPDLAAACYRGADLFWSFADAGPATLIDALGFGLPIVAFANPHARAILGPSGILVRDKSDPRALGALAALLLGDAALRTELLEGQRRRFEALREAGEVGRTA